MAFGQYLGYVVGVIGAIVGGVIGSSFPGVGTFAGAALGFSIGSMIGGIAGQAFWPERAELNLPPPPQPHETRLQFSSWGMSIPIQYGSGRLAGNIIYMSDINKTVTRSKHRQDGVRYYEIVVTYTATVAIAFCEGPISGIGRIWVNNKIFVDYRDPLSPYYPSGDIGLASANLDTSIARQQVFFSIHFGTETQSNDTKISELLTAAEVPGYRGTFYITFIDFPIGEFAGVPKIEVEIEESMVDIITTQDGDWTAGGSGLYSFTSIALDFGYTSSYMHSIFRFQNIRLHNGQEVSTAKVRWTCMFSDTGTKNVGINIKAVASDDAPMPTNYDQLENLVYGSAVVNYSGTVNSKLAGVIYDSPDIATIIQEIIDRPGWKFGNSLIIVFRGDGGSVPGATWVAASADNPSYDTPLQLIIT